MQRLPIARSFRLALVGLTVVLAVIAGFGVASLYNSRQRYENTLSATGALTTAAANLYTAGLVAQEVTNNARGPTAPGRRAHAGNAYRAAVAAARVRAAGDPGSLRLIRQAAGAQAEGRFSQARADAVALQARQQVRDRAARSTATSQSRRALIILGIAGVLALLSALGLGSALIAAMRRPLEELVSATRELASGTLDRRVQPAGPRELRELGSAFNAMAGELEGAHRRLEAERQRLAVVIESLRDALIVTEPGSSQISAVNPTVAVLVPELAVGRRTDGEQSPLPTLDAALSGETFVEHQGKTLAVTAARLGTGDNDEGVVWTVRDATERAKLERAKSEFVATASHELRSPLTSIKGFIELLHRSPENMSQRQREFVEIILKSTDRLTELVSHLLDVARIEADHVEIDLRPMDAGEAAREVAELMGPRIEEKHQRLSVHVAPAAGLVLADPSRLRQIVANLVTNAHLYTGEGGSIHVRVEPERAWIQIAVQDDGVGMTDDQAGRVFERFYRAGDGASGTPGTGLGLSIVKSLVELHGGQITVESEPGIGSTFRVLLPAAVPAPETLPSLEAIRGRRVLIVDDERAIAELIAGQLTPLGVDADIATKGAQALEMLRTSDYDVVTLDVLMPEMGGLDVLARIREDARVSGTPIVFVSVFAGRRELAGEWVVSKPIDADELRNVLAAAVESGRSRVLVVGREEVRPALEPALDELGIRYHWELTGAAAARVCAERRFEVALVDVGVRNPQAVLQALDLRGRRLRRAAILFSDGKSPAPTGLGRLGLEVVPVNQAATAVLAALRGQRTETVPRLRPVR
ncbi:MAG TPA: ATP-binding protein [Solirubrobacteraceae bacterium]|jgi:signal transduction histidine kinase/CheY-like chemotaxis protein/HAMP domain-containing protein